MVQTSLASMKEAAQKTMKTTSPKHVSLAGMARDTADCRNRFSAKWSARREGELIRMLAHEGTEQMRILWLRSRQYNTLWCVPPLSVL